MPLARQCVCGVSERGLERKDLAGTLDRCRHSKRDWASVMTYLVDSFVGPPSENLSSSLDMVRERHLANVDHEERCE